MSSVNKWAAMAISANWLWKRHDAALPSGKAVMFSRLAVVVVLSLTVTLFTVNAPFWSYPSPDMWKRPRFNYGWPIMWKGERMQGEHMIGPLLNLIAWTVYFMLVLGYRKWKNYIVMSVVFAILFVPYAKFVGIRTHYRNPLEGRNAELGSHGLSGAFAGNFVDIGYESSEFKTIVARKNAPRVK